MMLSQSPDLLILEILNFSVNMIFLILFIHRFMILRSFAINERFKDYFPKIRIFLPMIYVVLNLWLLVQAAVQNIFDISGVDMALVVVGEGINSIILFVQLFVLRMELLKEQSYTRFHLAYFFYLCLLSAVRFVIYLINDDDRNDLLSVILSAVLILDSIALLTYWITKKQSLPHFQLHTNDEIKSLKHHSKLLQNVIDITERSFRKASDDNFPYILPFVCIENGKIKIILEISNYSQFLDNCDIDSMANPNINSNTNPKLSSSVKLQHLYSLNCVTRQQESASNNNSREILSCGYYNIEEIKHLYVICSRFPIKKGISFSFAPLSLPEIARELQQFLMELFKERRWYQPSVLKYLKIPLDRMKEYSETVEKYSVFNKETELDQTLGCKVQEDKNAIFFSLSVYKHLWVDDHYQFYIRVVPTHSTTPYYPIKRFSVFYPQKQEFQDFHNQLKLKIRSMERELTLPMLPKKHLFHWDEDQEINQRRAELERYLRLLYNDYTIAEVPFLKELLLEFLGMEEEMVTGEATFQQEFYEFLSITKGEISKCLIRNDLVTYYELRVFQQGLQVASLWKRFSQFQQLHQELERWMNNTQVTYKTVTLPERLYYKSEAIRHQKLRHYLQTVVEIPRIGRVYAVNSFFNMENNDSDQISLIHSYSRPPERSGFSNVINEVIVELTENKERRPEQRLSHSSKASSRRFSQIINNLGDPAFD